MIRKNFSFLIVDVSKRNKWKVNPCKLALGRFSCLVMSVPKKKVQVYGKYTCNCSAGYLLVCKLSKVWIHGVMPPRIWLKLPHEPRWKGEMPLDKSHVTTTFCMSALNGYWPTNQRHAPYQFRQPNREPQWKNMGSFGGGWTCTLPLNSELSTQLHSIKLSWGHIDLSFCSELQCGILEIQGNLDYTDPKHLLSPGHLLGILSKQGHMT